MNQVDPDLLAIQRTTLAHERTLMAWVRTSASLTAFGFTLNRFFEFLNTLEKTKPHLNMAISPRAFALAMIMIGTFSLVAATVQHRMALESLARLSDGTPKHHSVAMFLAICMALVGVATSVAVMLHM